MSKKFWFGPIFFDPIVTPLCTTTMMIRVRADPPNFHGQIADDMHFVHLISLHPPPQHSGKNMHTYFCRKIEESLCHKHCTLKKWVI